MPGVSVALIGVLLMSIANTQAETKWQVYDAFDAPLSAKLWAVKADGGTAVAKDGVLKLDAGTGSVEVQSTGLLTHRGARFTDIMEENGRTWCAGLVSDDGKSFIFLRRDSADSEGLFFTTVKNGKEVVKQDLGVPAAASKIDLVLDWHDDGIEAIVQVNKKTLLKKTLATEDVADAMHLKLIAYFHARISIDELAVAPDTGNKAAVLPPTSAQVARYASIWQRPTEVLTGAGLHWAENYRELWGAEVPDGAADGLALIGPGAKSTAHQALLVNSAWTPLALLPITPRARDGALLVTLPAWARQRTRVLIAAGGTGEAAWPAAMHVDIERFAGSVPTTVPNVRAVRLVVVEAARPIDNPNALARWQSDQQLREIADEPLSKLAIKRSPPRGQWQRVGPGRAHRSERGFYVSSGGFYLSNGVTGVGLAFPASGAGIQSLYCLTTGREAIDKAHVKPVLWRLELRRPDGTVSTLSNVQAGVVPTVKMDAMNDGGVSATVTWGKIATPGTQGDMDVVVTIKLPADSALAHWHIEVQNRLKGAVLAKVLFPIIPNLGYAGESDALVHTTWSMMRQGELIRHARGLLNWLYMGDIETSLYPSGSFPIQHISTSIGSDTVVYIGWHDGQAYPKGYTYDVDNALTCWNYPENSGDEGVSYSQPYETVIGPMRGDWFDAAAVYRNWAHQQSWCRRGPKAKWPAVAKQQVAEIAYWARPDWYRDDDPAKAKPAMAETVLKRVRNEEQWLKVPRAIHWYVWHKARFDGDYPDYFPARQGFNEEAEREAVAGWTVCPFINGFWYDLRTSKGEEAKQEAVVDNPSGQSKLPDPKTIDPLRQSSIHAYMCPSSAWWGTTLAQITGRIHQETKAQMVYLDVSANAQPMPCYNRAHQHPPGRGKWWSEGMNRQVTAIKTAPGSTPFVMSECFNESLGATLDTNLIWTDRYPWEAPMLGSIYGGWLSYCGSRVYENENITAFTAKLTRDVFWGGTIGHFVNEWWADDNNSPYARAIINLVLFQHAARQYVTYGEMVRPPQMVSAPIWLKFNGWQGQYSREIGTFEMEAIERAAWRAPDGKIALILMNYDDQPHRVEFDLDSLKNLQVDTHPAILQAPDAQRATTKFIANRLQIELPSRTPTLVVLGRQF